MSKSHKYVTNIQLFFPLFLYAGILLPESLCALKFNTKYRYRHFFFLENSFDNINVTQKLNIPVCYWSISAVVGMKKQSVV